MDEIKDAFQKVKKDILALNKDLFEVKKDLSEILYEISTLKQKISLEKNSAHNPIFPADNPKNSAHNVLFRPLKDQNQGISIGNGGVPADRQTDRQTDRHIISKEESGEDSFEDALKTLESLDNAKKEIRLKFKRLTDKEFLVFSTIYQLEEEREKEITYSKVSRKLDLTESSIRDYVVKICKKGAPIEKIKVNNKTIHLSISKKFQKLASLSTILQLRDI
jgi:hypothetical protein|tara:strand:- start:1101 stop:1763 length:663 start_codon:yes stop_codon:yes gene_type:complete